jgi:nucleotide-binding universal stress UspA family protein
MNRGAEAGRAVDDDAAHRSRGEEAAGRAVRLARASGRRRPALEGPRPRKPTPAGDRALARPGAKA